MWRRRLYDGAEDAALNYSSPTSTPASYLIQRLLFRHTDLGKFRRVSESGLPESSLGLTADVVSLQRGGQQNCFPAARTQHHHSHRESAARRDETAQIIWRLVHLNFLLSPVIVIVIIGSRAALAQLVSVVGVENQLCPEVPGGPRREFLPVSADIYSNCSVEL